MSLPKYVIEDKVVTCHRQSQLEAGWGTGGLLAALSLLISIDPSPAMKL